MRGALITGAVFVMLVSRFVEAQEGVPSASPSGPAVFAQSPTGAVIEAATPSPAASVAATAAPQASPPPSPATAPAVAQAAASPTPTATPAVGQASPASSPSVDASPAAAAAAAVPTPESKFSNSLLGGQEPELNAQERAGVQITEAWRQRSYESMVSQAGTSGSVLFKYDQSYPSVVCAILQVTDIELEPGEVVTQVNVGDSTRWSVESAVSGAQTRPST